MEKVILFQGDSITDAGRSREGEQWSGYGYPTMVKGQLGYENPGKYVFYNRGISGNRVVDLYARIKQDMINLKPDYISILIGVNDVWHEFGCRNGVDAAKYEKIYGMLIEELLSALPNLKIMILEPFVLPGTGTQSTEEEPGKWETFRTEVLARAAAAKRVAEKYALPFVELQNRFDAAAKTAEPSYWLMDGVHPTAMGHDLIKRAWLEAFAQL